MNWVLAAPAGHVHPVPRQARHLPEDLRRHRLLLHRRPRVRRPPGARRLRRHRAGSEHLLRPAELRAHQPHQVRAARSASASPSTSRTSSLRRRVSRAALLVEPRRLRLARLGNERELPRRQGQLAGRDVQVQPDDHDQRRLLVPDDAEDQRVAPARGRPDGVVATCSRARCIRAPPLRAAERLPARLALHDLAAAVDGEGGRERACAPPRARRRGRASRATTRPSAIFVRTRTLSSSTEERAASAGARRRVVLGESRGARRGSAPARSRPRGSARPPRGCSGACAPRARRGAASSGRRTWRTRCPTRDSQRRSSSTYSSSLEQLLQDPHRPGEALGLGREGAHRLERLLPRARGCRGRPTPSPPGR